MSLTQVYIGLGSNLHAPLSQLQQALAEIAQIADTSILKTSSFYRSAAIGPAGQPDYINAVSLLETGLTALQLLDRLQAIENSHGRVRELRWGARTLELDILLWGQQQIDDQRLQVPHPQMPLRSFVLVPLAEIAPAALNIVSMGRLAQLVRDCPFNPLQKISPKELADD